MAQPVTMAMAQSSLAVAMSSSVRGRPCLCLVPVRAAAPRVLSYSTTSRSRPPFPGLKTKQQPLHCAADDQTCPDDDPVAAWHRGFRDEMDDYARKFLAAYNAVEGCSTQEAMVEELELTLFRDEDDKLITYMTKIASDRCILYAKGRGLALMLCSSVRMAIHVSASVAANSRLRVNEPSGISFLTVEQIIGNYVSTFLKIAEDTCHRKIDRTSIISFLHALRGLAAISHILIQEALDAMNNIENCSKNFSTVYDVDALNHDLNCKMKELEMNFTAASDREAYELLRPTFDDATYKVSLFVNQMTSLRKRVVTHIQQHVQGHTICKEDVKDKEHIHDKECINDEEHDAS